MRKSISHERVVRYCIREHVCKSPDGLFLESSVNSPTLVLYSLLARSLGIGMKPCNNVWRLGKRVQEGRDSCEIFLLCFFPKQGCCQAKRRPEFQNRHMQGCEEGTQGQAGVSWCHLPCPALLKHLSPRM